MIFIRFQKEGACYSTFLLMGMLILRRELH